MKRKLPIILVLSLMLIIAGCARLPQSNEPASTPSESVDAVSQGERISVVSTLFPPYDFARQIAGDHAEVTLLLPAGSESHTYEPTPQDILRIQNCDIFLYIGGESETWVKEVLDSMDTSHMRVIRLMDCVGTLTEEIVEGMEAHEEEHAGGPGADTDEPAYDEHIWTSPKNAIMMSNTIASALEAADPAHADAYRANADAYVQQLEDLDTAFRQIAATAKRHTLVFGDRFPFRYFADAYGFSYYAAFPGCAEEAEPSAATVAFLIDHVRAQEIPVVFYIELSNERMADTICEATGAKKLLLHSCHNVSKNDFDSGATYVSLMRKNAENLKEAVG